MSIAGTDALARVAEIQQMLRVLDGGPQTAPSAGGADFGAALTAAQGAVAPAAVVPPATGAAGGFPYAAEINAAASRHGIDPALLAGLVKQESGFDPAAVSPAGATGLTQLMPATARGLGVTDSTDPAQALDGGAKYLRQMLDQFGGDERLALAAYNAGPGAVTRHGGVPPYAETQAYVTKVLANRDAYAAGVGPAMPAGPGPLQPFSPVGVGLSSSGAGYGTSSTFDYPIT